MKPITESHIETFTIETLQSMGWEFVHGLAIAPGAEDGQRKVKNIIHLMFDEIKKYKNNGHFFFNSGDKLIGQ